MALNRLAVIEYLEGAFTPDFETAREEVMTFIATPGEPTAALATPAALALAAAGADTDLRALLWLIVCAINDETVILGARCYMGDVGGVPTLLVRRLS